MHDSDKCALHWSFLQALLTLNNVLQDLCLSATIYLSDGVSSTLSSSSSCWLRFGFLHFKIEVKLLFGNFLSSILYHSHTSHYNILKSITAPTIREFKFINGVLVQRNLSLIILLRRSSLELLTCSIRLSFLQRLKIRWFNSSMLKETVLI